MCIKIFDEVLPVKKGITPSKIISLSRTRDLTLYLTDHSKQVDELWEESVYLEPEEEIVSNSPL